MSPVHTRLLTRITAALALSAAPACGGSVDVESVSCYEPDAGQSCLPKDEAADRLIAERLALTVAGRARRLGL